MTPVGAAVAVIYKTSGWEGPTVEAVTTESTPADGQYTETGRPRASPA